MFTRLRRKQFYFLSITQSPKMYGNYIALTLHDSAVLGRTLLASVASHRKLSTRCSPHVYVLYGWV